MNDQKCKNKFSAVSWSLRLPKDSKLDDDFLSMSILSFQLRRFTGYLSISIVQPHLMYVSIWLIMHARQAVLICDIVHIALQKPQLIYLSL
jgi:hypothetical protein